MEKGNILDISWEAIIKVFIGIFVLYIIYLAREMVLWFFFAMAISVLLEPAINFLRKIFIPKILSILIIYFSIFGILGLLIYLTAPIFISELRQFSQNLPQYFNQISPFLQQIGIDAATSFQDFTGSLSENLEKSSQGILKALTVFFGGIAAAMSILTMAFLLSLEDKAVERVLLLLSPKKYEGYIGSVFEKVQKRVAGWFGARVLASLFVGVASYIVFFVFGIKYAFVLALLSGFLNFIPYIGPLVTGVLLFIMVGISSQSWMLAVYILIAFTIIQQIESTIFTPLLMKKMADIPPILVLFSLFLGARMFGFLGMIFAVPIFGIIYEVIKEFLERRKSDALEQDFS